MATSCIEGRAMSMRKVWPALALIVLSAAGCSSQQDYPKQIITVLPPGAGAPGQAPPEAPVTPYALSEAPPTTAGL
jgi:hypothetical protein